MGDPQTTFICRAANWCPFHFLPSNSLAPSQEGFGGLPGPNGSKPVSKITGSLAGATLLSWAVIAREAVASLKNTIATAVHKTIMARHGENDFPGDGSMVGFITSFLLLNRWSIGEENLNSRFGAKR